MHEMSGRGENPICLYSLLDRTDVLKQWILQVQRAGLLEEGSWIHGQRWKGKIKRSASVSAEFSCMHERHAMA